MWRFTFIHIEILCFLSQKHIFYRWALQIVCESKGEISCKQLVPLSFISLHTWLLLSQFIQISPVCLLVKNAAVPRRYTPPLEPLEAIQLHTLFQFPIPKVFLFPRWMRHVSFATVTFASLWRICAHVLSECIASRVYAHIKVPLHSEKCILLLATSLGSLTFSVQTDVCAEFDTRRMLRVRKRVTTSV